MKLRATEVMARLEIELSSQRKTKSDRWKEDWELLVTRHPEVDEELPIGQDDEYFELCMELMVFWADRLHHEVLNGNKLNIEDVHHLEMIVATAYLAGKDSAQTHTFQQLMGGLSDGTRDSG